MNNKNSEGKNHEQQEEPMTEEEREFAEELDQKIQNAQQKLDQLGLTQSRLSWLQDTIKQRQEANPLTDEEKKEKFQQLADKAIDIPTIDRQGRKIFTLEEILNNYNNAWGFFKYRELPICWSNLKDTVIVHCL
ncbi:unnamed protein product [Paramecium octaurelia]|uniref:Uncharacterized protein n=1 Tax=Paramecium octaurelia TaxID=43137 RepID=A0A8S1UKV7_PAROT|nr:unnamed protein product [Paramecium octaurelia]